MNAISERELREKQTRLRELLKIEDATDENQAEVARLLQEVIAACVGGLVEGLKPGGGNTVEVHLKQAPDHIVFHGKLK